MTKEAVIVATARTPIGKAYRGAFNDTAAPTLGGHAIAAAVKRAGIEPGEVDDVIMGCAMQQGSSGANIGRTAGVAAGLPSSVSGMSLDRQCASGMMAIATAAKQIVNDNMPIVIGGGLESISLVQNEHRNAYRAQDPNVIAKSEHAYMSMLETAEIVSKRYNISRDQQDEYALQSQQRTAAAQQAGKLDDEIVPLASKMLFMDKETKQQSVHDANLEKDEGNRPTTTLEGLQGLKPVFEGGVITAGNASQLSDGASASVLMDSKLAEQKGLEPLGAYRGMAAA
ncbi:MAG: acetyl-CoA C-acyltransferase, partial [Gammaproteobacteria bacterium]|nr:acetyl-CoA C-acyltransferase [Gammaproteobacteria bacterium]